MVLHWWLLTAAWSGTTDDVGAGVVSGFATLGGEILGGVALGGGASLVTGADAGAAVMIGALGGIVGGGMGGAALGARATGRRAAPGLVATGAVGLTGLVVMAGASASDALGPAFGAGVLTLAFGVPLAGGIAGGAAGARPTATAMVTPMVDPVSGVRGMRLVGTF